MGNKVKIWKQFLKSLFTKIGQLIIRIGQLVYHKIKTAKYYIMNQNIFIVVNKRK